MKTSTQDSLNVSDIFGLLSKYRTMIILGTLLSLALFTAMAIILPQRFKSYFVLAIHSSYFQNPLTRDLTPDIYDSSEMRSQRESLIRQSLSSNFLDFIGDKYGIYQSASPGIAQQLLERLGIKSNVTGSTQKWKSRSEERQDLLSRINITNLNNDTFRISFIYSNPDIAFHVAQDIYLQMTHSLGEVRRSNLIVLRDAIRKRLDLLASSLPLPAEQPFFSDTSAAGTAVPNTPSYTAPRQIDNELAEVRRELRMMTVRYTEDHPIVKELRERERSLSAMAGVSANNGSGLPEEPLSVQVPADAAVEMYKDLNRKLNYLNITLESDPSADVAAVESPLYPTSPLWPQKGLFVLWGLAAGLLGGFFVAALREYFDRARLQASDISEALGIPMIGKLPVVPWGVNFHPTASLSVQKMTRWN